MLPASSDEALRSRGVYWYRVIAACSVYTRLSGLYAVATRRIYSARGKCIWRPRCVYVSRTGPRTLIDLHLQRAAREQWQHKHQLVGGTKGVPVSRKRAIEQHLSRRSEAQSCRGPRRRGAVWPRAEAQRRREVVRPRAEGQGGRVSERVEGRNHSKPHRATMRRSLGLHLRTPQHHEAGATARVVGRGARSFLSYVSLMCSM